MDKSAKIYIAGHRGRVGSAILRNLQAMGYANFVLRTHAELEHGVVRNRDEVDAIACTWDPAQFDPAGLKTFRSWYPKGANYLVCPLSVPAYVGATTPC